MELWHALVVLWDAYLEPFAGFIVACIALGLLIEMDHRQDFVEQARAAAEVESLEGGSRG